MGSLEDIAPIAEQVKIDGKQIDCYGVSSRGLVMLLQRFPEIKKLFDGKAHELKIDDIFKIAPFSIAAIIAAGTGKPGGFPGDEKKEAIADSLGIEQQYDLLAAIGRRTMPNGVGPFVLKMQGLSGAVVGFMQGVTGQALDTHSQEESKTLSQVATAP